MDGSEGCVDFPMKPIFTSKERFSICMHFRLFWAGAIVATLTTGNPLRADELTDWMVACFGPEVTFELKTDESENEGSSVQLILPSDIFVYWFGPGRELLPSKGHLCPPEPVITKRIAWYGETWLPGSPERISVQSVEIWQAEIKGWEQSFVDTQRRRFDPSNPDTNWVEEQIDGFRRWVIPKGESGLYAFDPPLLSDQANQVLVQDIAGQASSLFSVGENLAVSLRFQSEDVPRDEWRALIEVTMAHIRDAHREH
jgi:hypothetical protein